MEGERARERESERARQRDKETERERDRERKMFETGTRQRHTHTCTHLKVERMKQLVRGAPVSTDRIRAYAHFGNDRAGAKLAESTKFSVKRVAMLFIVLSETCVTVTFTEYI
jgi:hypothetical protein